MQRFSDLGYSENIRLGFYFADLILWCATQIGMDPLKISGYTIFILVQQKLLIVILSGCSSCDLIGQLPLDLHGEVHHEVKGHSQLDCTISGLLLLQRSNLLLTVLNKAVCLPQNTCLICPKYSQCYSSYIVVNVYQVLF